LTGGSMAVKPWMTKLHVAYMLWDPNSETWYFTEHTFAAKMNLGPALRKWLNGS
jgi:hypothetical protein